MLAVETRMALMMLDKTELKNQTIEQA